jgi:hypothetical protein
MRSEPKHLAEKSVLYSDRFRDLVPFAECRFGLYSVSELDLTAIRYLIATAWDLDID